MRRYSRYFLTLASIAAIMLASGCGLRNRPEATSSTELATPLSGTADQEQGDNENSFFSAGGSIKPVIALPPNSTIVSIANQNFDLERNEEQVLVLKDSQDPASPLKLMVAAYDTVLETHGTVFEDDLKSIPQRGFALSFMDIVGDHNLELICRGMDEEGRQALDIYHRTTSPSGFGLYYKKIFSYSLKGSLEIEELDRSGAYQVGQANGVSFPIIVQSQDEESENPLDLIQRTFYWRFTEDSYIEGKVEKIAGEEIVQLQLRELYRRNAKAFETFLDGSWYLTDDESGETDGAIILDFDVKEGFFTYYTGELQESYQWESTYKVLMSRVVINGDNELVPFIRKQFSIQVEDLDSVRIRGNDPWHGLYSRLSPRIARALASGAKARHIFPELSGTYYSDAGGELYFEDNSFRLVESGKVLQGGFALYEAGAPVLELRILNSAGLTSESRRYRLDFNEETRDQRIFRTLFLIPGIVGIYGFEATEDTYTRYEQIETVEEEPESGTE